ncbi:aldo/keto reductase [Sinisalibacter lacisalsi]|uniref:Oxidoreductase n=1 Tax=Sinisalibacter lacisalsi TaxID=1526570 RepID=A0ABQ1Q9M7_9RHOB|nr:aldo/keto reductase [Sinisalibacter lacisalsi]GGD19566.1 oxidoreductase [Sinisalibacter lacisalsi]
MRSRLLGKTGFEVSEIGMGCWQLGGDFGPIEDDTSQAALKAAHDAGITFYDTADVYGAGRSETQVGLFLKGAGKGSVVATKVGRTEALYPDGYEAGAIGDHLRASAERLGVDSLDLVQLHCVPPAVLEQGAIFDIMEEMKAEGLTRNWGASVETIAEARLCLARPGLATLQMIFNLYRQDAGWEIFDEAKEKNVGIIVRLPLASGVLTGKFEKGHRFPETDHRNYNADGAAFSVGETFSGIELDKAIDALDWIRPHVPEGMSLADFALRWILDHEAVSSVIAGVSRPDQAARNARVSELPPLDESVHAALREVYVERIRPLVRCPI